MKPACVCWTAFVAAVAASVPAAAIDVVNRRSAPDKPAQGTISEMTRESVTVKPRLGDPVKVPANDIASIRWDGEPAKLNLARADEEGGRFEKALATYQEILGEIPAGKDGLRLAVQFMIASAKANLALADSSKLDDAIKTMEDFQKAGTDNYRFYDAISLLGRLYMAKQDFVKARSVFESLAKAPWKDYQMAAKIATAQVLLAQADVDGALKAFDEVLAQKADSPLEQARRFDAMLGQAKCLIQQKQHDKAAASLEKVIAEAPPEQSRLQAEAYVRQGDCLQAMGKTKEAVLAYLHVPVLFAKEQDLYAESLYHLARLWPAVERPERGADARAELEAKFPKSEWTKKLTGDTNP